MKNLVPLVLLCAAVLPCACQQLNQAPAADTKTENKALPPLHLGAVHQVYPDQGFALLRIIGPLPSPGTVLITHPADGSNARVGNVQVTADAPSGNRIIAAEIRAGHLVKGDRVFLYRHLLHPEEQPAEEEEIPSAPANVLPTDAQQTPTIPEQVSPAEATEPTVVEPTHSAPTPATEHQTPDHIFDIPDNIDDWQ